MVLTSFTQNMNIKCCEFFCQVVQKYIINNLVKKKKRNCKPSWPVYSKFTCYFLKQPLHNYGVYKMAGKEEGEAASTASQGTQGKLYKKSPGFDTSDRGKQTRFRNDRTVHSLQQPTRTKHWGCKGKTVEGNPSLLDHIMPRGENKDFKTPCWWVKIDRVPSISNGDGSRFQFSGIIKYWLLTLTLNRLH